MKLGEEIKMPSTGLHLCNCGWYFSHLPQHKECSNCGEIVKYK